MAVWELNTVNKRIENYIMLLNRARTGRRRLVSLVLALSLAVSGNVFWLMRGIGTALTDDLVCGLEEHVHSEECYEKKLICEEEHEHTDECYEMILICGKEEHKHTEDCYAPVSVQRETRSDWEKTIPKTRGVYASDLMNVAASQTGYVESEDGYTRYGDWYGNPTADWNVMFISFCMHYAGISKDKIPGGAGCWAWQVKLEEKGLLITDLNVLPQIGDIVLADKDGDGKCDRAGIVADVTDGKISLIEGDVDGKVGTASYTAGSGVVFGYVSVNSLNKQEVKPDDEAVSETAEETTAALPEGTTEEPAKTTETTTEEKVSILEFNAETESGICVKATAPAGAFPEGVTMTVADVNDENIIAKAEGAVEENKEVKGSIAVDITFKDSDGNEIEPAEDTTVNVSISIPEDKQIDADSYSLFHVNNDGATEVEGVQATQSEVVFESDSFSIFILTATGERSKDKVHAWIQNAGMGTLEGHREYDPETGTYGDYIVNDREYPYVLRAGDTITLIGYNDQQTPRFVIETDDGNNNSNNHRNIEIVGEQTVEGDKVTAVISGVGSTGWRYENDHWIRDSVRIRLEGTDEYFYIQVDEYGSSGAVVDFDNVPVYNNNNDNIWNYYVRVGQTISVAGTPNQNGDHWPYLANGDNPNGWIITNNASYQQLDNGKRQLTIPAEIYYGNRDNVQIITMYTPQGTKKVRIIENVDGNIDHADIEIADGGVYTNVQIEGGNNGELYKTVTEYQSFVYDVNYSEMLNSQGGVVQFYDNNAGYAPITPSRFIGGKDPETGDCRDYWSDPNYAPGNSQYELTSKYTCPPGETFDMGHARWSNKRFFYQDVAGAIFDVELQIIPRHVQKFIWNADANGGAGGWDPISGQNIEYDIHYNQGTGGQYRTRTDNGPWSGFIDLKPASSGGIVEYKNEVFNLGKQAVIDAYNKCPNHSGLDFTVHHDLATIEFTASKVLTGRTLQNNEFLFKLFPSVEEAIADPVPTGIASARNDASGKVVFENVEFENVSGEHTYTYYMREIPGDDEEVIYDPVIYKIIIDVNKVKHNAGPEGQDIVVPVDIRSFTRLRKGGDPTNDNDYLPADQFVFNNTTNKYVLPDTGGGGIAPYFATGTVLIVGALILLLLRRRKEVDL